MVDATLADLIGGEMLFPGKITPEQDRDQRTKKMRQLFDDGLSAMRRWDYAEAKACFDAMRLCFDIATSVRADQIETEAKERDVSSPGPSERGD